MTTTAQTTNGNGQHHAPSARMTLAAVTRGTLDRPLRVVLYGVEGIGKSTFGADAPAPIFLGAEDGTAHLDVARFPQPRTWADAVDALRVLHGEKHDFRTLVVDTVDWLEPLCWRAVCDAARKPDIEAFGYGKGYLAALEEWRRFVHGCDALRAKGMNVVLLAHALVRPFRNPEGEDYDRFTLKVNEKAAGLLREWADAVLFANFQSFAQKQQNGRAKGVGGARTLYTTHRPAADAKNRWSLPDELPMGWRAFADALAESRSPARVATLRAELDATVEKLCTAAPDVGAKVRDVITQGVPDAKVAEYLNRARALLNEHARPTDNATND